MDLVGWTSKPPSSLKRATMLFRSNRATLGLHANLSCILFEGRNAREIACNPQIKIRPPKLLFSARARSLTRFDSAHPRLQ